MKHFLPSKSLFFSDKEAEALTLEKLDLTGCTLSQVTAFSSLTTSESVVITIFTWKQGSE
jgi:hypothetical protein